MQRPASAHGWLVRLVGWYGYTTNPNIKFCLVLPRCTHCCCVLVASAGARACVCPPKGLDNRAVRRRRGYCGWHQHAPLSLQLRDLWEWTEFSSSSYAWPPLQISSSPRWIVCLARLSILLLVGIDVKERLSHTRSAVGCVWSSYVHTKTYACQYYSTTATDVCCCYTVAGTAGWLTQCMDAGRKLGKRKKVCRQEDTVICALREGVEIWEALALVGTVHVWMLCFVCVAVTCCETNPVLCSFLVTVSGPFLWAQCCCTAMHTHTHMRGRMRRPSCPPSGHNSLCVPTDCCYQQSRRRALHVCVCMQCALSRERIGLSKHTHTNTTIPHHHST